MKIISLLPSATEIVASLGATHQLCAVSHSCDWPEEIRALPRVTATAVDSTAAAGAIDAQVRAIAATGAPLYTIDEARIRAIAPDVIVTQALCDVCAVSEGDVRALAADMTPSPVVVTLDGKTMEGVFTDITRVAAAIDASDEAEELIDGLRARLRHVHETLKAAKAPRPRVAMIEWTEPLFAGGHWVPEMVARAGGVDVLAKPGDHSAVVTIEQVRAGAPDVLFVGPCGYDLAASIDAARALLARDDWAWARALPVWALDANALTSRPGPRLVHGVETMAAAMHPALFGAPLAMHAVRVH
ncbi:MAG: ABC transporter substrate-binding protein [Gemmatimonadetes bacterium]|nr:ABC transporter substrate-binding protein [Gemmatimonadota bacterium]